MFLLKNGKANWRASMLVLLTKTKASVASWFNSSRTKPVNSGSKSLFAYLLRPSLIFRARADLSKELLMTYQEAGARNMSRAAGCPRCWSRSSSSTGGLTRIVSPGNCDQVRVALPLFVEPRKQVSQLLPERNRVVSQCRPCRPHENL